MTPDRRLDPDRLKTLRAQRRMTQWDLALKADLSIGTVQAFERGANRIPTPQTLRKLAAALNCTVPDLFVKEVRQRSTGP